MSINIIVYVTSDLRHAPFLYQGINQLKLSGYIDSLILKPHKYHNRDRLVIKNNKLIRINRPYPYSIIIDILTEKKSIKIGFDLQDWDYMFSYYSLKNCKIIFKRAYSKSIIEKINKEFNNIRILPFGFTYNTKFNDYNIIRMSKISKIINRFCYSFFAPKYLFNYLNSKVKYLINDKWSLINNSRFQDIKVPDYDYIFFQVEYHNYHEHVEADRINNYRLKLIKALKKKFGKKFIGGMWSSKVNNRIDVNCKSSFLNSELYLLLVKNAKLVISTNGFGNSLPWKMAEYLKLGKCIISQNIAHSLPHPLIDGYHIKIFDNIEQCINISNDLLNDKEKTFLIGNNAKSYYNEHINPKTVIKKCLNQSINL